MGLGILEDHCLRDVPGTSYMDGGVGATSQLPEGLDISSLKYDRTSAKPVVLIPQPSNDPNDPLNWSLHRRDFITIILCLVCILAGTLGPILAADTIALVLYWERSVTEIALLTGWHLCGVGVAGFFVVPTARVWGKRHMFVIGSVLLVLTSVWGAAAKTYNSFLWARIFQGVAVAPFESLANAAIGDMYYVHERGKRMAFANFAMFGGAFFTPVVVGRMAKVMGWRWTFWMLSIFCGAMVPLVFLFIRETAYRRDSDPGQSRNKCNKTNSQQSATSSTEPPRKNTFRQWLALFNGRKTDDQVWKLALRPLPLLFQPAIFWGMLIQGALIGWTVLIGVVLGAIFIMFDEEKTGRMYAGAFVGAIIGFIFSGLLADWSAKLLARRNRGIYEPEFRILLVIPQTICGVIGLFGFGHVSENSHRYRPEWASFFFGMEVMGMVLGATSSALYLYDAHKEIAIESFTCLLLFKNFFSFALTWYAFDWVTSKGVWPLFWRAGVSQLSLGVLSVLMYIFGKKNRSFFFRHNILRMVRLDTPSDSRPGLGPQDSVRLT